MNESEIPNRQSTTSVIDGTRVQCWHGVERFRAWGPWTWSWVPKALTKAPPLAHNHTILVTTLQVLRPYGSAPGPQLRPRALPLSSLLVPLNALQCILWGHQTPPSATGIGISFVSCNHIWSPFEIGTTRIQTDISSKKTIQSGGRENQNSCKILQSRWPTSWLVSIQTAIQMGGCLLWTGVLRLQIKSKMFCSSWHQMCIGVAMGMQSRARCANRATPQLSTTMFRPDPCTSTSTACMQQHKYEVLQQHHIHQRHYCLQQQQQWR